MAINVSPGTANTCPQQKVDGIVALLLAPPFSCLAAENFDCLFGAAKKLHYFVV